MMFSQHQLTIPTPGRRFIDLTGEIKQLVQQCAIHTGLCHVFLHHTSASLILCENDDPLVQQDLATFMSRLVPDGDSIYQHTLEGADDMASHIRTVLTQSFLVMPITNKQLALGKWQGIYLWEHRLQNHKRQLTITLQGQLAE